MLDESMWLILVAYDELVSIRLDQRASLLDTAAVAFSALVARVLSNYSRNCRGLLVQGKKMKLGMLTKQEICLVQCSAVFA